MTGSTTQPPASTTPFDHALRHAGLGDVGGCGFGTPDGPCPNRPTTSVAVAAAHPDDGVARWVVPAWMQACAWHREQVAATVDADPSVTSLWAARGGASDDHPAIVEPMRRSLARWLERTPDGIWSGELGL